MQPDERNAAYLFDMLKAAEKIQRYIEGKKFGDFTADELLRDAVERNIEIIGEAARRLSESLKREHPEIPWPKIIAQRNVLIHEYNDIDVEEIWEVASFHIPRLTMLIKKIMPPIPSEE
ncbi:MAG: DUF86 domain-containing protein [Deltaproteobacteria bacterium]|nr:DUF86 domain-containing protein [Deltaproteobacteria bacterium]